MYKKLDVKDSNKKSTFKNCSVKTLSSKDGKQEMHISRDSLIELDKLATLVSKKQLRNINVCYESKSKDDPEVTEKSVYRMHITNEDSSKLVNGYELLSYIIDKSTTRFTKFRLIKPRRFKLVDFEKKSFPTSLFIIEV